jgi:sulfite exporter TauE/SafE
MLQSCLHALAPLTADQTQALLLAMLATGLAGGATHCAGMCGPFVVAQLADGAGGPVLRRLAGALLLPYQAGRALGYAALGAVAGGSAGAAAGLLGPGLLALPLGLAAALMLAQGLQRLGLPRLGRVALPHLSLWRGPPAFLPLARLLGAPESARRRFAMGLLLAALPCGLLHAALAGAAATGSAVAGAAAMLAFVLGTVPGLAAAGLLGRFLLRRAGPWLRPVSGAVFLLNALLLGGLSVGAALA